MVAAEAQVGLLKIILVSNVVHPDGNLVTDALETALNYVSNVSAVVPSMMKLVLAAMVTDNGNVEGAAVQVKNFAHYAEVKDIRNGNTHAKDVVKLERFHVLK